MANINSKRVTFLGIEVVQSISQNGSLAVVHIKIDLFLMYGQITASMPRDRTQAREDALDDPARLDRAYLVFAAKRLYITAQGFYEALT